MQAATVARLSKVPNIIGIKEATGDLERLRQIQQLVDSDFNLLSGDDATTREFILQGGHGSISVTANVVPAQMAAMCQAALDGNAELAQQIDEKIEILHSTLFIESNPIPVKWAVAQMGLCGTTMRLPLTVLNEKYHDQVRSALQSAGAL